MERTKAIAERIREARKEKGLSQRDLSALCGITQGQISRIEGGKHRLQVRTIHKIYTYLGLDVEEATSIGEKIRQERMKKGLTQSALAEVCGVRVACISKIETGKSQPTLKVLLEISKGLGLDVKELVAGVEEEAKTIGRIERGKCRQNSRVFLDIFQYLELDVKELEEGTKIIGERIKQARLEKGLRQWDLACICDISEGEICRIEKGNHRPKFQLFLKLSQCLELDVIELSKFMTLNLGDAKRLQEYIRQNTIISEKEKP